MNGPTPIQMKLVPIVALFKPENLAKINSTIDSTYFMTWLLPLYYNICEIMDYGCGGDEQLCGISDDCAFGEECVQNSRHYICQSLNFYYQS